MFHFKQFSIDQTGCAMKINTDGVLLGALAAADEPEHILDIGTGTGVIALMLAQRFANTIVDAVEIDKAASHTARINFQNSKFNNRLALYAHSFESYFSNHAQKRYDLIVSNPPFYINSLESPEANKNTAKHSDADFFENLVKAVSEHLTNAGAFWLILSIDTAELVKSIAQQNKLYLQKVITIKSYPDSNPHREILVFSLNETKATDEEFVIYKEEKVYSNHYQNTLRDFFTIFK